MKHKEAEERARKAAMTEADFMDDPSGLSEWLKEKGNEVCACTCSCSPSPPLPRGEEFRSARQQGAHTQVIFHLIFCKTPHGGRMGRL